MITGRTEFRRTIPHLVFHRSFAASRRVVWDYLTDTEKLALWFCRYDGDPKSGRIHVTWEFEPDMPMEAYVIEVCQAPNHLRVFSEGVDGWTLDARLTSSTSTTELIFAQVITESTDVADVGPGWEYYLDRLVEAVDTGRVATLSWSAEYRDLSYEYAHKGDAGSTRPEP